MKKLLISASLLWAVALTTVAQDNFKLTGKIDGADSDTLCIEYVILQPEKQIVKRKVAVEEGEFSFSAELHEAYAGFNSPFVLVNFSGDPVSLQYPADAAGLL